MLADVATAVGRDVDDELRGLGNVVSAGARAQTFLPASASEPMQAAVWCEVEKCRSRPLPRAREL